MPELPEVETTRRGIAPYLVGVRTRRLLLRRADLRWPIPQAAVDGLAGVPIDAVERRAKYLLIRVPKGAALIHLGMSGSLRMLAPDAPLRAHDHWDLELASGRVLRFNDPRRFGALLWQQAGSLHPRLAGLGPEPLSADFTAAHFARLARGRRGAVKMFLMDQSVVVGVGNIYASEALFEAGIHPTRAAGRVSRARYAALVAAVRRILAQAIEHGGTTLRDFIAPDGSPGYFEQELMVYGRAGMPCRTCGTPIRKLVLGQRSTFHCPRCQR